ncbi:hypothetical protein IEQ34_020012 [Dendrobium chrysotoxum]|uniref:Uncharacterized protein n=1 Tax=Dendrobium chrysotoxum TaxID=161865 RepID=A0AAV7GAI8_DENCH|nr:hypothetical protein IEQ34_020012 [Dendrobium chrysotoxum]
MGLQCGAYDEAGNHQNPVLDVRVEPANRLYTHLFAWWEGNPVRHLRRGGDLIWRHLMHLKGVSSPKRCLRNSSLCQVTFERRRSRMKQVVECVCLSDSWKHEK